MGVRETQKRGVVRQACKASRSAAFGLRPGTGTAGFIGKRRAVSSIQAMRCPWGPRPVSLGRCLAALVPPDGSARPARLSLTAVRAVGLCGQNRRLPLPCISPVPAPAGVRVAEQARTSLRTVRPRPYEGPLSARASPDLARSGNRRRPRRSPKRWRASAHRGRCQAARS